MIFLLLILGKVNYALNMLWEEMDVRGVVVFDSDGDGRDEVYAMKNFDGVGSTLIKKTEKGEWFYRARYPGDVGSLVGVFDCDGDGVEEIFTRKTENDTAYLYILSPDGRIKKKKFISTGKDRDGDGKWSGYVDGVLPFDHNGDGIYEILCVYDVGWDASPRGIVLIDGRTFENIWNFRIGPSISTQHDVFIADMNGDGYDDIVVGGFAYNNGNVTDISDDYHTYVHVISNQGKLLWQWKGRKGIGKAIVAVGDIGWDFRKEVILIDKSFGGGRNIPDTIYIFNNKGEMMAKRGFFMTFSNSIQLSDVDFNTKKEIVVGVIGESKGQLLLLDHNLNILKFAKIFKENKGLEPIKVVDLNRDGEEEIIAIAGNSAGRAINPEKIVILDRYFNIKAIDEFKGSEILTLKDEDIFRLILIKGTGFSIYSYEKKPFRLVFKLSNPFILSIFIIILLLLGFYGGVVITRRKRRILIKSLDSLNSGICILGPGNKVIYKNAVFDRVINGKRFEKLLSEIKKGRSVKEKIKKNGVYYYISIFNKEDITTIILSPEPYREYAERIFRWAELAKHFTHSIKNQIWGVLMGIEEVGRKVRKKELKEILSEIHEEINKIITSANNLSAFSKLPEPVIKRGDLNKLVEKVVNKFKGRFKDVNFIFQKGELPPLNFDEKLTEIAIENILKNAVESLEEKRTILIGTFVEELPDSRKRKIKRYASLMIQDTGRGIPKEIIKRVGEPYFTTKRQGSGLGIYITKQILKEQGAELYLSSKEGKGTRVTIRFPL